MKDKLWAGRFSKEADSRVNDFNSSIRFDSRMYEEDIAGSQAHARMLYEQGIISQEEYDSISVGLSTILNKLKDKELEFSYDAEDIHMFIESELTALVGEPGKRLHTARSRNDQVALDVRMYCMKEIREVCQEIEALMSVLCDVAQEQKATIMPGYTHLQRAQPITFGHHLMAYCMMLLRDVDRLKDAYKRTDICPLGSGALAGTTYPINRERVAEILGFSGISQNSLDGVSDRDFCIEICGALSILMMHLSRFSEEIILWCSWEFKFVELDDAFATGSSIMPQKKNPDVTELIRGKTGRVYGHLQALLSMMKNLPLAYNKDMQEDKEAVFDSFDTVHLCLTTLMPLISTMRVNKTAMREAAAKGFLNATDCADYLVKKGMAFRDAYKVTGRLVARCIEASETLETLPLSVYREECELFSEDLFKAIALERCVGDRNCVGGPAPEQVELQIAHVRSQLGDAVSFK